MEGFKYCDPFSFATESKREELILEGQEYHLCHQILSSQKPPKKAKFSRLAEPEVYLAKFLELMSVKDI